MSTTDFMGAVNDQKLGNTQWPNPETTEKLNSL